eukprot:GAHX01001389.1.p1 GENE.GAHX01001389.1~~GAHX01001389.1.p1  ORF type:complete len:70 (+),score=13.12 GAHX01001389.1:29-238(+)
MSKRGELAKLIGKSFIRGSIKLLEKEINNDKSTKDFDYSIKYKIKDWGSFSINLEKLYKLLYSTDKPLY